MSSKLKKLANDLIHLQLPLSPRQQEQLLSLLTTSFNSHLDSQFGALPKCSTGSEDAPRTPTGSALTRLPAISSRAPLSNAPLLRPDISLVRQQAGRRERTPTTQPLMNSASAADAHIRSILSNPLFNTNINAEASETASSKRFKVRYTSPHLRSVTSVFSMMSNPDAWFASLAGSGTATVDTAYAYLQLVSSNLRQESDGPRPDGPTVSIDAQERAVLAVLDWIWASDQVGKNPKFFLTYKLATLLGRLGGDGELTGKLIGWIQKKEFLDEALAARIHREWHIASWKSNVLMGIMDAKLARDPSAAAGLMFLKSVTEEFLGGAGSHHSYCRELHFPAVRLIRYISTRHPLPETATAEVVAGYEYLASHLSVYVRAPMLYSVLLRYIHPTKPERDPSVGKAYLESEVHQQALLRGPAPTRLLLSIIVASGFMARGEPAKAEAVIELVMRQVGSSLHAGTDPRLAMVKGPVEEEKEVVGGSGGKETAASPAETVTLGALDRLFVS